MKEWFIFCRFFLEVCLDQVKYMGGVLRLDELVERIRGYGELRNSGMIAGAKLRVESARMLQEVLLKGEAARGAVIAASGLKERTGRSLLGQLLAEGLLVADTPKGEVRLGLPMHAAGWYFPELFPTFAITSCLLFLFASETGSRRSAPFIRSSAGLR